MKPSDLSGAQRRLFEAFRAGGMSEDGAIIATVGRSGDVRPTSSFDALTDAFVGLGLSEDAARIAAVGRGSEATVREAHAVVDQQREDAVIASTVRDLAERFRQGDRLMTEEQAQSRACAQVREAFIGSAHSARVNAVLEREFPARTTASASGRRVSNDVIERLKDARRRGIGVRVVKEGRPTGEILSLAEVDRLIGGH